MNGSYVNLKNQMDKLTKQNKRGSIDTQKRYEKSFNRFCKHLSNSHVQKLRNIQDKHVESYVEDLEKRGCSASYIKTELAGIRFYHSKIENAKIDEIPSNEKLKIENRSYRGIDRKWSPGEFNKFIDICHEKNKDWIADAATISRETGFRIHEVTRLSSEDLKDALERDVIEIKGKGGRVREVALREELRDTVSRLAEDTEKYQKVFVSEDEKTHEVIKDIQRFIRENRDEFQNEDSDVNLSFHGLRHTFANEEYERALEDGCSVLEAELRVSSILGHNRAEVTRIYLAK